MIKNIISTAAARSLDEINRNTGHPLPKREDLQSMENYLEKMLFANNTPEQSNASFPTKSTADATGVTASDESKAPIYPMALLETQMRMASLTMTLDYGAKIAAKTVQSVSDLSKMQ